MTRADFRLYLITDRRRAPGPLVECVRRCVEAGVEAVQLREKDLGDRELYELGCALAAACRAAGARFLVNDRADLARAVEAHGVHLTRTSYGPADARRILGPDALVGVSTHSLEQALEAQAAGADFVTFGPVFDTPSKRAYGPPVGLEELGRAAAALRIPVLALGGIGPDRVDAVRAAGAHGVAAISALLSGPDPGLRARTMADRVHRAWGSAPVGRTKGAT